MKYLIAAGLVLGLFLLASCTRPATGGGGCTLTKEQIPALRGLKLGMTREEIPSSEWREGGKGGLRDGESYLSLVGGVNFAQALLNFHQGKLYEFRITYLQPSQLISSVGFEAKVAESLNLTNQPHWRHDDIRHLDGDHYNCGTVEIQINGRGPGKPEVKIWDKDLSLQVLKEHIQETQKREGEFKP